MLRTATRLLLLVGSAAIGAAAAVALRADLLVGYGVGRALEVQKVASPFALATPAAPIDKAEVGDEVYWLTRTSIAGPGPLEKGLAVGDRITIAGRDGRAHTLEVVDLKEFVGAPLLKVAADSTPVPLLRVTARVLGSAEGGREGLLRFFIEVEEGARKPATVPEPQASLGRT
jgi:hypothetical protein